MSIDQNYYKMKSFASIQNKLQMTFLKNGIASLVPCVVALLLEFIKAAREILLSSEKGGRDVKVNVFIAPRGILIKREKGSYDCGDYLTPRKKWLDFPTKTSWMKKIAMSIAEFFSVSKKVASVHVTIKDGRFSFEITCSIPGTLEFNQFIILEESAIFQVASLNIVNFLDNLESFLKHQKDFKLDYNLTQLLCINIDECKDILKGY